MRICKHCNCEMIDRFDLKVDGGRILKVCSRDSLFSKKIEEPKISICPKCGEISLYIKNVDKILEK